MNLEGNLNLLKMNKACIINVQGREKKVAGLFLPIEENDIYLTRDESGKLTKALIGLNIHELREPFEDGSTHYVKFKVGKKFLESHPLEAEALKKVFPCNLKPFTFDDEQKKVVATAPSVAVDDVVNLPF